MKKCLVFLVIAVLFWPVSSRAMFPEKAKRQGTPTPFSFKQPGSGGNFVAASPRRSVPLLRVHFYMPALTPSQKKALRQAFAAIPSLEVHFDRQGRPTFVKGRPLLSAEGNFATADSPERVALEALKRLKGLFRLEAPEKVFSPGRVFRDGQGFTHVSLEERFEGVPVFGKELRVHLDPSGAVYLIEGHYAAPPAEPSLTPLIEASQAAGLAAQDLGLEPTAVYLTRLVFYEDEAGFLRLCWQVELGEGVRWRVFVDARQGLIVKKYPLVHELAVPGSGRDEQQHTLHRFSVWQEGGLYYFIDTEALPFQRRDPSVAAEDFGQGNVVILELPYGTPEAGIFWLTSSSPNQWPEAAVSVWYAFKETATYFYDTFGRASFDGQGSSLVGAIGLAEDNAFYAEDNNLFFFGIGDGYQFGPLTALDVVAHEFTHGVTAYSARLEYLYQSGALNEAFSDIFAAMVDREDWLIGEDVVLVPPYCLRNLEDPHQSLTPLPANMAEYQDLPAQEDNGGVHINAGIPAHAAYLLASRIGRDRAERIFYQALTAHLTPRSDFWDFCRALAQSAEELYGASSAEEQAAEEACQEVGISVAQAPTQGEEIPPEIPPAPTGDYLLFNFVDTDATGTFRYYLGELTPSGEAYYVTERPVHPTRPAPYYAQPGYVFFVDEGNNLWLANVVSETYQEIEVESSGEIWSIATSPASRFLAFTSVYEDDNHIYLWDTETGEVKSFAISFQAPDAPAPITTYYPDVLSFSPDGQTVFFDCLNEVNLLGRSYQFWTLGRLDLVHGLTTQVFTMPPEGYHLGNPATGQSKPYLLAYDVIAGDRVETRILNLRSGRSGLAWEGLRQGEHFSGWPSFNGDDSLLFVQDYRPSSAEVIVAVPVVQKGDVWQGDPEHIASALEDTEGYGLLHPVAYRPGQRSVSPEARLTPSRLDFGQVAVGGSATLALTLENVGNYPLEFRGTSLTGEEVFSVRAVHLSLDPGESYQIQVIFSPEEARTYQATLKVFTSDPVSPEISVPVTGEGRTPGTSGPNPLPRSRIVAMADPATAPVKVEGGRLKVSFSYTGPVDILVGVFSLDFSRTLWLSPSCQFEENFTLTVRQQASFSCQGAGLPVSQGYLFWLVSPKPIEDLSFKNDPYELRFYPFP